VEDGFEERKGKTKTRVKRKEGRKKIKEPMGPVGSPISPPGNGVRGPLKSRQNLTKTCLIEMGGGTMVTRVDHLHIAQGGIRKQEHNKAFAGLQ